MFNLIVKCARAGLRVERMINKAIHTFALLSEQEEAGELASSGVFWKSVPTGDSVRQVGEAESMAGCYDTPRGKKYTSPDQ